MVTKINVLLWINFVGQNIEMGWFNSRWGETLLDISWKTQNVLQRNLVPRNNSLAISIGHFKKGISYINQNMGCPIYPKNNFWEVTYSLFYRVFIFPEIFCAMSSLYFPGDETYWRITSKAFLMVTKINVLIWINFVGQNIEMGWFNSRWGETLLDISWKTQNVLQRSLVPRNNSLAISIGHFKKGISYINQNMGCPIYPKNTFWEVTYSLFYRVFNFPEIFCAMS